MATSKGPQNTISQLGLGPGPRQEKFDIIPPQPLHRETQLLANHLGMCVQVCFQVPNHFLMHRARIGTYKGRPKYGPQVP